MSKIVCPGQDTRFWDKGDIFDVECAHCGYAIEFFRDDGSRRCPQCGRRVANPRLSLGCAQWCEQAEKCLGFDPKKVKLVEYAEESLADQLIEAVKAEFGADQKRITHALAVLENAQELLRHEAANPRIVVAAALLHDIGIQEAERKHGSAAPPFQELEGPPIARRILEGLDFAEADIQHIARIVGSHHSGRDLDTPEFRIVWDADWLVNLPEHCATMDAQCLREFIQNTLRTATGKALAIERLLGSAQDPARLTLTELADLIEREHHGFLREWLPRLDRLLAEAPPGPGGDTSDAAEPLRLKLESLRSVLEQHLRTEEQRVFPRLRALEARGPHDAPPADQGAASLLIEHLEFEHGIALAMLAEIEARLPQAPAPAADALRALAANLREHVRLENDFLFPRAKKLDQPTGPTETRRVAHDAHH